MLIFRDSLYNINQKINEPMVNTLNVNLDTDSYDIYWENNFDSFKAIIQKFAAKKKNYILTNDLIFKIYGNQIKEIFPDSSIFILKDGEEQKNLFTIKEYGEKLLASGANRTSILWAFGGGVIGDITGFLASIYMRGIRYFQIPTTLLSMVDSSVGGKTGVNIEGGKNMMGTFYQPSAVFINTSFLKTLADREFKSGLSEVIKSALLNDPELFHLIENNVNSLSRENVNLNENISMMSVKVKADVVSKDEKENDLRAILNLGHTLAHALESFYQYRNISHGEAVSIGIAFAVFLAVDLNILSHEILERIHILFKNLGMMYLWSHLPGAKPEVEIIIELMKGDKKNINNNIRFVFISDIGKFLLPQPVELPRIKSCLEKFICH